MKSKRIIQLSLFTLLFITTNSNAQITDLQNWLALKPINRSPLENLNFSKEALTQDEAIRHSIFY